MPEGRFVILALNSGERTLRLFLDEGRNVPEWPYEFRKNMKAISKARFQHQWRKNGELGRRLEELGHQDMPFGLARNRGRSRGDFRPWLSHERRMK